MVYSQIPFYGPNKNAGASCPIQSFSATDTTFDSKIRYFSSDYQMYDASASVAGSMKLTVGTDTLCTFYVRLVMHENPNIKTTVLYDSSGWHTIIAQTGDYIPIENAVGATAIDFSFDLAAQDFWKPCIGVQVSARQGAGIAITKQLELYLIESK